MSGERLAKAPPGGFKATYAEVLCRLTEAGWNAINRTHPLLVIGLLASVLALVVSIVSVVIALRRTSARMVLRSSPA